MRDTLSSQVGVPANELYFALQNGSPERATAECRGARHDPADRTALHTQRARTDAAIRAFDALSEVESSDAADELRKAIGQTRQDLRQLSGVRVAVDQRAVSQSAAFDYFTGMIADDL